jgi:cytochrome c556
VPAAEAGRLADTLRLLCDDATVKAKPTEFRSLMTRSAEQAQSLEELLAKVAAGPRPSPEDAERLNAIASQLAATCKACHNAYRD